MDRYVVIGNPVSHSRSPEIHAHFARDTGEAMSYERLLAAPGHFARAARDFFASGGRGANVTLPFKADAFAIASIRTERADAAGAVNTLTLRDGAIVGDNTDGAGLVRDLIANLGLEITGARVLLLGAGGAARGVVAPLLAQRPASLVIANRTTVRALELAERFGDRGPVIGMAIDGLTGEFDIVVNATSSSTHGELLALPEPVLRSCAFAYDMAYGPAAAPFLQKARSMGAGASDGIGMLVEQAAESFFQWRGKKPSTAPVIAAMRSS
jgi:shikimate dehydrogenase